MTWLEARQRDEKGAIAVVVALLSIVLFVTAALAVDLGNVWSRKRDVQKQVDVAALSAGYLLPQTAANTTQIANEVANYLQDNSAVGQSATITGAQLLNGVLADGEVTFQNDDGSACTSDCTRMKVVAPVAEVDFAFAGILGVETGTVQRDATVRVMGSLPPAYDMLPFWLPSGCALGPAQADTDGGTNGGGQPTPAPTTPTPTPTPTATPTGSPSPSGTSTATTSSSPTASPSPSPTFTPGLPVGPHTIGGASASTPEDTNRTMSGITVSSPNKIDRATIRFYAPDGSRFVDYAATIKKAANVLTVPTFQVSVEVTDTPGEWKVYALVQRNKITEISGNNLLFTVTGGTPSSSAPPSASPSSTSSTSASPSPSASSSSAPAPTSVPVGCMGQDRGNFGQLDSPRKGLSGSNNKRLALNVAEGLDHQLVPFQFAPGQTPSKDCGSSSKGYVTGAQPDNVSLDGRNCIQGDTGNDGSSLYDGMIAGVDGKPGRLSITRPGNSTSPLCVGRSNMVIGSATINNDLLSCFLRNGATLADVVSSDGANESMLDPSVLDSPRMVWLPVVYATDRAQKNFQPILEFVPAFITDETQTAGPSVHNGLEVNGGGSVKVMSVFVFDKDALPLDFRAPTITYGPLLRSIVRLVN